VTSYRRAEVGDAGGIAAVHVRTWQVAYRNQVPDDYLDALSVTDRSARWRELLGALEATATVLVAEDDGAVVGFASAVASRDDDAGPMTGELAALYVAPACWDRGVGRELLGLAVAHLGTAGFTSATLWVLQTNARARRFYAAAGWSPDGREQLTHIGSAAVAELRYRTVLPSGPGSDPSVTSRG
jgi:ribosomal protein S18 acetylase RimI-like enzyme